MAKTRGVARAERLIRMREMYLLRGYTDQEMADALEVTRETVYKDRQRLMDEMGADSFEEVERGRHKIRRTAYMSQIGLNIYESVPLYLSARKIVRQLDIAQPHMARTVEKLALCIRQPMAEKLARSAQVLREQPVAPERVKVFERVAQAWVEQRKVHVDYVALGRDRPIRHTLSPYLLEPSVWGDAVYVIGHSEPDNVIMTFKLDRIEHAFISGETFTLPDDFDEHELLKHAWGIWTTGEAPAQVRLRFTDPTAIRRLEETRWHPQQKVYRQDDGSLIWEAPVAEWREMLPWVRGWGAACEVLEPEAFRESVKREIALLAAQYAVTQSGDTPAHYMFWGKASASRLHRLIYHMIDVAQAARTLWETLPDVIQQEFAGWLGLSVDDAGRLVAFLAGGHDLGKASPAFQDHPHMPQQLRQHIRRALESCGLGFPRRADGERRARHEVISAWALGDLLAAHAGMPEGLACLLAQALGGHHGSWPTSMAMNSAQLKQDDKGDDAWQRARAALIQELVSLLNPPAITSFHTDTTTDNRMLTLLSGIVTVADWLGSDENSFPYEENILPLESYLRHARQHALLAVSCAGWEAAPPMPAFDFQRVFGFTPTRAQRQITEQLKGSLLPALAIIEAPMGSGKTEAALAVYAQWAKAHGYSGLYVAMPTTATSNQMHTRVAKFLSRQLGTDIEPLLVHSQALARQLPDETDTAEEQVYEDDRAAAQAWFLPRRKSLLAPFGVGTVDQAFMSVLQTRHFFVRLLGLSHKVVIFDEVHAYDVYMSELFKRLLVWLRQIGASVIVLSATLPEETRLRLIQAYTGSDTIPPDAPYPRLTWAAADGKPDALALDSPEERILKFDWIASDASAIVARLADELREGGCAVVICNTVGRAQELYERLNGANERLCDEDNLILFHARFPLAWREELEQKVLDRFGPGADKSKPNPQRPPKAIVVATQVVEQSLDLDFDVMISDHAPVDLLLQRAGRLHRHAVNGARKHPYRLLIAGPEIEDGMPCFERSDTWVYDEHILLRSWLALRQNTAQEIHLPRDVSALVEAAYGSAELTTDARMQAALRQTQQEMAREENELRTNALSRLVREPDDEDLLWGQNAELEEDNPAMHEAFQALTRSDRPGVTVVCLHRVNGELFLEPDDPASRLDLSISPDKRTIRELLRHSMSVRHPDPEVERCLLAEPDDPQARALLQKWKKVAALRHHRVVIFDQGVSVLNDAKYRLRLNKADRLGLQFVRTL